MTDGPAFLLPGAADLPAVGGHDRREAPSETLARLEPHFAELGITRLGELTGLDELGLPVAFATRPNSCALSVSLGKGLDRNSALISAAMEAAETAVAERKPASTYRASLDMLAKRGDPAIDIERIARCHSAKLDRADVLEWVQGIDLVTGADTWVPWSLVGIDHRAAPDGFHDAFEVSSDGLASGSTVAEAALHGLLELIERDAYALAQLKPRGWLAGTEIELRVGSAWSAIQERLVRVGLQASLYEITSDICVPVIMARLASGQAALRSAPTVGYGCHWSVERAVVRALTEAVQGRLAVVAGARDDFTARAYAHTVVDPAANVGSAPHAARQISPFPEPPPSSIGARLEYVMARVSQAGAGQIVVVDLKAGAFGCAVVRVIASDLQIPLHGQRTQLCRRGLRSLLESAA